METRCVTRFAGWTMRSDMLLFFRDFFWRSGLLEYLMRSHVRGHALAVRRRWTHPESFWLIEFIESWLHQSFRGHWPYRFRSNHGVVVPGLMLFHLVIKLACVGFSILRSGRYPPSGGHPEECNIPHHFAGQSEECVMQRNAADMKQPHWCFKDLDDCSQIVFRIFKLIAKLI